MSTQKGNATKKRAPKYKNEYKFQNNKYDTTDKMKAINNLCVANVCQRCKDCIEWKIKYKKYKPLTVPGKCTKCGEKRVKFAYHNVCTECALHLNVCAKCNQQKEIINRPEKSHSEQQKEENFLKEELKHMRLREKRTLLRKLEKDEISIDAKCGIECSLEENSESEEDEEFLEEENDSETKTGTTDDCTVSGFPVT